MQLGLKGNQGLATRQQQRNVGLCAPRVAGGRVGRRTGAVKCAAALSGFSGQRVIARPAVARRGPGRARGMSCKAM